MTISEQLKALRIEAGLTQEELAKRLGNQSKQNVYNWETGRRSVGLKLIENWASACGKSVEIVFKDQA